MNLEEARKAGILPTIPYRECTRTEQFLITREQDLEQQIDQLYKSIHSISQNEKRLEQEFKEDKKKLEQELAEVRRSTLYNFSEFMLKHNVWIYPYFRLITGFALGFITGKWVF